jgi:hypothetical protein
MLAYINDCLARAVSSWMQYADECKAVRLGEIGNRHVGHAQREANDRELQLNARVNFSEHLHGTGI